MKKRTVGSFDGPFAPMLDLFVKQKQALGYDYVGGYNALHVFDTSVFTVDGAAMDSYMADVDTDADYTPDTEVISDGYFHESEMRSAPYFDLRIDGITTLNEMF